MEGNASLPLAYCKLKGGAYIIFCIYMLKKFSLFNYLLKEGSLDEMITQFNMLSKQIKVLSLTLTVIHYQKEFLICSAMKKNQIRM